MTSSSALSLKKYPHRKLKSVSRLKRKKTGLWENQSIGRVAYSPLDSSYDFNPSFELKETDSQFIINCELPGVDAKFEDGVLTIHIPKDKNKGGHPP